MKHTRKYSQNQPLFLTTVLTNVFALACTSQPLATDLLRPIFPKPIVKVFSWAYLRLIRK